MDVKFIAVPSDSLDNVPIKNGQVIALTDVPGYYYDMSDVRHRVGSALQSEALPAAGQNGVIYVATKGDEYCPAGIYFWDSVTQAWEPVGVNRVKGSAETKYRSGDVSISPEDIGLGKVENLSVAEIFKKMQKSDIVSALEGDPVLTKTKGKPGGVASLDDEGKVPSSQLPATKEFIVSESTLSKFPEVGTKGALYRAEDTDNYYIWDGEHYTGVPSMSTSKSYSGFTISGASSSFYNNYCLAVKRNLSKLDSDMPSTISFKISVTNPNQVAESSTIIATAVFGADGEDKQHLGKIVYALVDHAATPVVSNICMANLTANGWSSGQPTLLGFHIESENVFKITVEVLSYTNCSIFFLDAITRHGALSTAYYSSNPLYFNTENEGLCVNTSATSSEITNSNTSVVTAAMLYKLFGDSSVPKASAIKFTPNSEIKSENVQDAILEAAKLGGDTVTIMDWEEWSQLTDDERNAKGIVVVTNTPIE